VSNSEHILQWQLCDVSGQLVGDQFDNYTEARNTAMEKKGHAVFELWFELTEKTVVWTPEGGESASVLYWPPLPGPCEHCEDGPEWLRGILLGANGPHDVEACTCQRYDSDIAAAMSVAARLRADVVFWQHDPKLHAELEQSVAAGEMEVGDDLYERYCTGREKRRYRIGEARKDDDCVGYNEYPWIEVDWRAVDWRHYWRLDLAIRGVA
jgi:hypothetical protein